MTNLWTILGVCVYDLPDNMRAMFPYASANEEDCIPQHELDSHRELKAVETSGSTTSVATPLVVNTSKVLTFPNR